MSSVKQEVEALLEKLPDDCTLEDVQYHLFVLEKIQRGIDAAAEQGVVTQTDAEDRFAKWRAK